MNAHATTIRGTGTALVTPFRGGQLDLGALGALVEGQIAAGVDFLVPCGTTGEAPTLTDEERLRVIACTVETSAGRAPVVAGTGTYDTAHSVALTREARRIGADAALAVCPYYNRPPQEGLYRHFRAMIDEGGLPVVLYEVPTRSAASIDIDTVARVFAGGGVAGIKETGTVARVTALGAACGIPVLCGDDGLTLPMMALGAVGVISVASNVVPEAVVALVGAMAAGGIEAAREQHGMLAPLFRALFMEPNPIPVKAALADLGGIPEDTVRLPLVSASRGVRAGVAEALARLRAPAR